MTTTTLEQCDGELPYISPEIVQYICPYSASATLLSYFRVCRSWCWAVGNYLVSDEACYPESVINMRLNGNNAAFLKWCILGKEAAVRWMLEVCKRDRPNWTIPRWIMTTAFEKCCEFGYLSLVQYLFELLGPVRLVSVKRRMLGIHGADSKLDTYHNATELAINNCQGEVVEWLLGQTPVMVRAFNLQEHHMRTAIAIKDMLMMKALVTHLGKIAALNRRAAFSTNTILGFACESGWLDLVKYLVEEWGGYAEYRMLHTACCGGHVEVAKYLVHIGCEFIGCIEDIHGEIYAKGFIAMFKWLLTVLPPRAALLLRRCHAQLRGGDHSRQDALRDSFECT